MTKTNELIKAQCCASLLEVPKCELVAKVVKLENTLSYACQLVQDAIEINLDNFSVEDVERLNNEMIDLYRFLEGVCQS